MVALLQSFPIQQSEFVEEAQGSSSLKAGAVPSYAHLEGGAPAEAALEPGTDEWSISVPATGVDKKDADTPDNWVRRDPRILRLTGRHPLNCEPPMDVLMGYGFITPPPVHFVRNHGAVPRIKWSEHRIEINGLVDRPMSISMDELVAMPSVTIPVTLVCAGNRRKEENMVKKSIGFNWGPCATSCTYWTGVRLRDLLLHCGVKSPEEGARYVAFRGPKGELPKGEDGSYGTSVTIYKAMDLGSDILVAYKQNHRWLTPDHGFPVRMLIPGFIGGRMVKWLSEITVQQEESQNFYHFMDNRVLPSHVDEELAKKEGWWYKPDYIINDLNINSAIARPWHDETILLKENTPYKVCGYAYAGGGKKIIRVEISLDGGVSWRLAEIRRFEKPNVAGKYWCWVHWDIMVPTFDFLGAKELLLRAWDEDMNTQPALITWNVMGMMNNCHFRVLIHPWKDEQGNIGLRFQHPAPVEVGELGNIGWREEENIKQQALAAALAPPAPPPPAPVAAVGGKKTYTMEEVAQHSTEESCWFVHEGKVYDATPFLADHPGGAESILITGGTDATDEFNSIHSSKAKAMLVDYYLGDLVASKPAEEANGAAAPAAAAAVDPLVFLNNPKQKMKLPLVEKIEISPNTRIFRFGLPTPEHCLGLPVGKHVFVYANINGENVMRAYTPTSSDDDKGRLDLLIKVYFANEHPAFPEGGKMSQYFERLKIGDEIEIKGPLGHFVYLGRGKYTMGKTAGEATHLSMIAGGTGITPCYQVLKAVLKDPEDTTKISLIFANNGPQDILLRDELDELANNHPERFRIHYVLSQSIPADWQYSVGRITQEMFDEHLFPASSSTLALMCGPPGMLEHAAIPFLNKMGYAKETHVVF